MRALAVATLALLPLTAGAASPADTATSRSGADRPEPIDRLDRMNLYPMKPGCVSIPRQVAGEDREYRGTRLDQLPPGRLLLAVHRVIDGCPQAVLASEERSRERERAREDR